MFDKYLGAVMTTLPGVDDDHVVRRFLCKGRVPISEEGCTYQEAVTAAAAAASAGDHVDGATGEDLAEDQQQDGDGASPAPVRDESVGGQGVEAGGSFPSASAGLGALPKV